MNPSQTRNVPANFNQYRCTKRWTGDDAEKEVHQCWRMPFAPTVCLCPLGPFCRLNGTQTTETALLTAEE